MKRESRKRTESLAYIALFSALITICSWITVPAAVPFTLQTLGIFLTVGVLGGKRGSAAVALYVFLGCIGIPVFSGFKGGIGVLLGATGGYIVGFIVSALFIWCIESLCKKRLGKFVQALTMLGGLILCYTIGTIWFMTVYLQTNDTVELLTVLTWCVIPFIIPDIVKICTAVFLTNRLNKIIQI